MCRAADNFLSYTNTYTQFLRIAYIYIRFPRHGPCGPPFPDSLTLVYLPRISEAELEINGTKIRPDLPSFVTLHRVQAYDGVAYGCRDKVRAKAGLRFEIYGGEEKMIKGTFRKEGAGNGWEVECRCMMDRDTESGDGDGAEVVVGVEGRGDEIRGTVRMVARRSRRGKRNGFRNRLEEIPEESEAEGGGCDTSGGDHCSRCGLDGCETKEEDYEAGKAWEEVNTEGVKWAVDIGIWVFCLGVGFLVSRASSKKLQRRRRRIL